jgi:hypothetical protein
MACKEPGCDGLLSKERRKNPSQDFSSLGIPLAMIWLVALGLAPVGGISIGFALIATVVIVGIMAVGSSPPDSLVWVCRKCGAEQ